MLTTKYEVWAYEQEVRVFVGLNDPSDKDGRWWFDFGDAMELREIIVGVQPKIEDLEKLKQAYEPYAASAELWWASMRPDAFALQRNRSRPPYLEMPGK